MAGGRLYSSIVTLFSESVVDDDNTGIQLLKAIREIFDKHGDDRISTPYMLGELIGRDNGEPWGAWWSRDIKNENIQGPSARLARLLKPFKIKTETLRWQDGSIAKGYKLEAFKDAFSRHIPFFYLLKLVIAITMLVINALQRKKSLQSRYMPSKVVTMLISNHLQWHKTLQIC